MITARELLELLGRASVDLDSPVWIGVAVPGLHEAQKAWVEPGLNGEGAIHITDEGGEPSKEAVRGQS